MPNFLILKTDKLSNFTRLFIFFGMCLFLLAFSGIHASASTNINSTTTEHWAWNDLIGWVNFYNTNSITVSAQELTGYASSSAGDISLDCATTRNGNICGQSNYGVTNDGAGNLSGWAWNDQYGWISFDCNNVNPIDCQTSNYRVRIDNTNGVFSNYAWNSIIGWISFNCLDYGCGPTPYSVVTSWMPVFTSGYLDSTTFDTGVALGSQLNSVLWHGSQPPGTAVRFQFATGNVSSGPWIFVGSDGTSNTYYSTGPDASLLLGYTAHNNARYFRYRVILLSSAVQTLSPRVDDVIVNWSP